MSALGKGRGAARAAMPALPVEVRGRHQHRLCHFLTAANIHDHGATRGTTSAGGGGWGPPAPQHRHTPSTRGPSTLPHQQQRRPNDRCAREQRARGGGEGPPGRHKVRDRQGGGTAVRVVGRRGDGAAPRRTRHRMRRCRGGGGGRPAPAARRGPARTCDHPPRPKYDSPPSCRKKRWAEFKAQSSPSPSSSLEAAAAAAVTPSYSPQRSRGDCHRRCRGNRVHRAVPLPHRSIGRGVHATEGRRPHEARAGG